MQSILDFSIDLAQRSGQLLRKFFRAKGLDSNLKKDHSIVTEADLASDELICSSIQAEFPNDLVVSEELHHSLAPGTRLDDQAIWIVDPLDGTTNFSLGLHVWGVLLARLRQGYPELAVLYFPFLEELYTAQPGTGAFLNGQPIHCIPPSASRTAPFFACCSRTFRRYNVTIRYKPRILGSSAYSLCCVARGSALIGFESTAKIWDIAGAWLVVNEAGGQVSTHNGSKPLPLELAQDYSEINYPVIAAATPELMQYAIQNIQSR